MPQQSDLNRPNRAGQNPFEDELRTISKFTAAEIAVLQSRLERQLGPEYISTRPGAGGGKVHYLAAEKAINLANEVFGFNGWSSAIRDVQVDFVDESSTGKVSLGLSVIVRVTLKDGTYHEDIGYGHIENCKGKAAAFEKAKKEAATDAMKRALRNFGNVLGNCLYDKDYLQRVTKIKIAPSRWDAENLHRHHDFAPIKKESIDDAVAAPQPQAGPARMKSDRSAVSLVTNGSTEYGEDEFDGNLFDEVDFSHPDEVRLDDTAIEAGSSGDKSRDSSRRPVERIPSAPELNKKVTAAATAEGPYAQQMQRAAELQRQYANAQIAKANGTAGKAPAQSVPAANPHSVVAQAPPPDQMPPGGALPGFVTGRSANKPSAQPFNPHAESPSIRRTAGVNSGKSEPILRSTLGAQTATTTGQDSNAPRPGGIGQKTNFVNPQADMHRRVGMPVVPPSPLANRGAYKPPTSIKRPAPADVPARAPLADTTNLTAADSGPDAKKPKTEPVVAAETENNAPA